MGGTAIGRILDRPAPGIIKKGDDSLVLPETYLGLEFEVENFTRAEGLPDRLINYWAMKEDHSLRNRGMEFVFNQPLFGKDITAAIDAFYGWQVRTRLQTSVRTGLHVHLDMREVSVDALVSFMMLYTAMEPLLYRWVGDSREESNFCVPLYYSDAALGAARDVVSALISDESEVTKGKPTPLTSRINADRFERYSGLNLQALSRFGSVEFRQLLMTFDKQRLLTWINIILSLKKEALIRPPRAISTLLKESSYNINALARILSPTIKKELSNFDVPKDLKCHVCHSAEEFARLGLVRKWNLNSSGKKYLGTHRALAGAGAEIPATLAEPPAPVLYRGLGDFEADWAQALTRAGRPIRLPRVAVTQATVEDNDF